MSAITRSLMRTSFCQQAQLLAGYTYHLIHVSPKPVSDTRLSADGGESGVDFQVKHMLNKEQVRPCTAVHEWFCQPASCPVARMRASEGSVRILISIQAQTLSGKVMVTMLKPDPGMS